MTYYAAKTGYNAKIRYLKAYSLGVLSITI